IAASAVELWISILGLVEKIKDLCTEFARHFFLEFPVLDHRTVPCMEAIAAKQIPAHRARASDRWRYHNRLTFDKAAPFLKRRVPKRTRRTSKRGARWVIDGQL